MTISRMRKFKGAKFVNYLGWDDELGSLGSFGRLPVWIESINNPKEFRTIYGQLSLIFLNKAQGCISRHAYPFLFVLLDQRACFDTSSAMASPGHDAKDCRIDHPVAVRFAGGQVALGYPITNPPAYHHIIPQVQLPAIPVALAATTGGEIPATSRRPSTDLESASSTRRSIIKSYLFLLLIASMIPFVVVIYSYCRDNPPLKSPTFQVAYFAVSNFSISDHGPVLAATWEADLTVVNPNRKIKLDLENIVSFVYYKSIGGQLSLSAAEPLHLDEKSTASITIRNYVTQSDTQKASSVEDIRRELQETGSVSFSLGVHLKETFSEDENTVDLATIYCEGLKVAFRFSGHIGVGTLSVPSNDPSSEAPCRISHCSWWKGVIKKTPYCWKGLPWRCTDREQLKFFRINTHDYSNTFLPHNWVIPICRISCMLMIILPSSLPPQFFCLVVVIPLT